MSRLVGEVKVSSVAKRSLTTWNGLTGTLNGEGLRPRYKASSEPSYSALTARTDVMGKDVQGTMGTP